MPTHQFRIRIRIFDVFQRHRRGFASSAQEVLMMKKKRQEEA
jgi:hypothetical protein